MIGVLRVIARGLFVVALVVLVLLAIVAACFLAWLSGGA